MIKTSRQGQQRREVAVEGVAGREGPKQRDEIGQTRYEVAKGKAINALHTRIRGKKQSVRAFAELKENDEGRRSALNPPDLRKLVGVAVTAGLLGYLAPTGKGVAACFGGTLAAAALEPVPLPAAAILGLATAVGTGCLTFSQAFSAFSQEAPWLVLSASFIARAVRSTGLSTRLALNLARTSGGTPIGLAFGLTLAEGIFSAFIPSCGARSGGITFPLARSLAEACGSNPDNHPRLGSYLLLSTFHASATCSSLFLTANTPNPLSASLAASQAGIDLSWGAWLLASCMPALASMMLTPLAVSFLSPPGTASTESAKRDAVQRLKDLGPPSAPEVACYFALVATVALWAFGRSIGLPSFCAAGVGIAILLLSGAVSWEELEKSAPFGTFLWYAALVGLALQLKENSSLIPWFSGKVSSLLASVGLPWPGALGLALCVYFYSHVFFASNVAHVSAMLAPFLSVAIAAGSPPALAALSLVFLSNLMGALGTTYGMTTAPLVLAEGYFGTQHFFRTGVVMSSLNAVCWVLVGSLWWKVLRLY